MHLTWQNGLLPWRQVLFLVLLLCPCLRASYYLNSERYGADVDEIVVEQNATIKIFDNTCGPLVNNPRSSNFTLAPEVCLSGYDPHKYFRLWEMPRCVGRDGLPRPSMLVTYSDQNCTGRTYTHPPAGIGPNLGWWITFPVSFPRGPLVHWSLIFHCHSEPFDDLLDPLKWEYTNGGELQPLLKDRNPLALCEHAPPRLTDGMFYMNYDGCDHGIESWKYPNLPIDTCQSTHGAKGLRLLRPATCFNGSRARWARYWDNECKDRHDVNEITDWDFDLDACQRLDHGDRQLGSVAFYCDGPDTGAVSEDAAIEAVAHKGVTLTETPPQLPSRHVPLPTPLPRRPWIVPFWKGLVLISGVSPCHRDDRYTNAIFQEQTTDSCYNIWETPLQIFQVPRCFNLTRANVAFFKWGSCKGAPVIYSGTDEKLLDTSFCMNNDNGYSSMTFWCEGIGPPRRYVYSYGSEKLLLVGGCVALLILSCRAWLISGTKKNKGLAFSTPVIDPSCNALLAQKDSGGKHGSVF